MDPAHSKFEPGRNYTETFTVRTADGTTQLLTITLGEESVLPLYVCCPLGHGTGNLISLFAGGPDTPLQVSGFRARW